MVSYGNVEHLILCISKKTGVPTSPSMHQQVSLTSCAPKASSCSPKPKLRLCAKTLISDVVENCWVLGMMGWKHPISPEGLMVDPNMAQVKHLGSGSDHHCDVWMFLTTLAKLSHSAMLLQGKVRISQGNQILSRRPWHCSREVHRSLRSLSRECCMLLNFGWRNLANFHDLMFILQQGHRHTILCISTSKNTRT